MGIQYLKTNLKNAHKVLNIYKKTDFNKLEYIYNGKKFNYYEYRSSKINSNIVYIDFSKIYYQIFYSYNLSTIEEFKYHINEYFSIKYSNKKKILYIDKGKILQKERVRLERYATTKKKIEEIDKEIDNTINEEQIQILKFKKKCHISKTEIINELLKDFTDEIIYCPGIDAEYQLAIDVCNYYNKTGKVPLLDSGDQDLILLLLVNLNTDFIICNEYYIVDQVSINIGKLTLFFNKSDYLEGISKICFTTINYDEYTFSFNQSIYFLVLNYLISRNKKKNNNLEFDNLIIENKITEYMTKYYAFLNIYNDNIYTKPISFPYITLDELLFYFF